MGDGNRLNATTLIRHAARTHGKQEIVYRLHDGGWGRYTYAECYERVRKAANVLRELGVSRTSSSSETSLSPNWSLPR